TLFLKAGSQPTLNGGSGNGDLTPGVGQAGGAEGKSIVPPDFLATSVLGNIIINSRINLFPAADGTVNLIAGQSITTNVAVSVRITVSPVVMLDSIVNTGYPLINILAAKTPTSQAQPLHATDPTAAIIYAGTDINGYFYLLKPAQLQAGRDIFNTNFLGE